MASLGHILAGIFIDRWGLVGAVLAGAAVVFWRSWRETMANCPEPPSGQPPIDASYWDRPTKDLVAEGHPMVAVWAVKNAMLNYGCTLDYPPPEWVDDDWVVVDTSP